MQRGWYKVWYKGEVQKVENTKYYQVMQIIKSIYTLYMCTLYCVRGGIEVSRASLRL